MTTDEQHIYGETQIRRYLTPQQSSFRAPKPKTHKDPNSHTSKKRSAEGRGDLKRQKFEFSWMPGMYVRNGVGWVLRFARSPKIDLLICTCIGYLLLVLLRLVFHLLDSASQRTGHGLSLFFVRAYIVQRGGYEMLWIMCFC